MRYFQFLGLAAGLATILAWVLPAIERSNSNGGHSHGSHEHGSHEHGGVSFDAGEPGVVAKVTRRITIVAREGNGQMFFEPSRISVKPGETVEFTVRNDGHLEHEFVLGSLIENASHAALMEAMPDMKHHEPNMVIVTPGKSAQLIWRFSRAGEYEFACMIPGHYATGMMGQVLVD